MADITKMEFYGLFTEETKSGKNLYLIFEFFNGKLIGECQYYEIWIIAKYLLEIFEKLSEKGIKFNKNEKSEIDVFEINLSEFKINIFDFINEDIKEEKEEKNGIFFNIGLILDRIIDRYKKYNDNYIFKGMINDLKNNKQDFTTLKTKFNLLFDIFYSYSLSSINFGIKIDEIINYNGAIYSGSL